MIYLDNAATTRVADGVAAIMDRYHHDLFANPSSIHRGGVLGAKGIRVAADLFAAILEVPSTEIVFTSGGTESDNLAIRGAVAACPKRLRQGGNVVCTAVEHPAVLDACRSLDELGVETRTAPVDCFGQIDLAALEALIDESTLLVSVMQANNEVGTVQPLAKVGRILSRKDPRPVFHVDAVQSFLKEPLSVHDSGIDLLSLSSHKLHGPKGVGLLWVKKGINLRPLFFGGGQQGGVRPGTQNVPGIVGFAEAVRLGHLSRVEDNERMRALRIRLWQGIRERIAEVDLNGHPRERLCNNLHINFHGCKGELLLHHLEAEGLYVSAGSACHSAKDEPSPVLKAMGVKSDRGALRLSLSRETTESEIDQAIEIVARAVFEVRSMS